MAFEATIKNTQKILGTVSVRRTDGTEVGIVAVNPMVVSGDGTFAIVSANEISFISGTVAGDTSYSLDIQTAEGDPNTVATVVLHVTDATLNVSITFGAPEPK